MAEVSASQSRAADSTSVSSTACRSKVERLMTLSTSAVAACCFSASFSSRAWRLSSAFKSATEALPLRVAVGAVRRFGICALRLRALASLLLALERRRIAHPKGLGLRGYQGGITAEN